MTEVNSKNLSSTLQKLEGSGIAQDTILMTELRKRIDEFRDMYIINLRQFYNRTYSTAREADIVRKLPSYPRN